LALLAIAGCDPLNDSAFAPGDEPDAPTNVVTPNSNQLPSGAQARVTADQLNLRDGPSTRYRVIDTMPAGAVVNVLDYSDGWYKVAYKSEIGWCSAEFLSSDVGGMSSPDGGTPGVTPAGGSDADRILQRATSGVGFSYHWGAGCWSPGSSDTGACTGNCPSCSHEGQWGADCSGFIAKVWQVPGSSDLASCQHPYTTADFYNGADHWGDAPRDQIQPADAFVHYSGSGHIFLYESGDSWGWVMAYEAKGCSTGIQHDSRTVPSGYKLIRREGM
jgi:hypothetical protein